MKHEASPLILSYRDIELISRWAHTTTDQRALTDEEKELYIRLLQLRAARAQKATP